MGIKYVILEVFLIIKIFFRFLYEIFKILRGKNTKLVLYVYDSFLFDVDKSEKDVLKEIAKVINDKNLQFKVKTGTNYANIK